MTMVIAHAAIIGYMRSRVAELRKLQSTAVELGTFRFQSVEDPTRIYHFRLHAVVDPMRRHYSEERLARTKMEIHESAERMLRLADHQWLEDPSHQMLRDQLMEVVLSHLNEPLIQRVLITDWLVLPAGPAGFPTM